MAEHPTVPATPGEETVTLSVASYETLLDLAGRHGAQILETARLRARVAELERPVAGYDVEDEAGALLEVLTAEESVGGCVSTAAEDALRRACQAGADAMRERAARYLRTVANTETDRLDGLDVDAVLRTVADEVAALPFTDATESEPSEPLFYIQDARAGGDLVQWWRPKSGGYTVRLDEAGLYPESWARAQAKSRPTDVPRAKAEIDALATRVVSAEQLMAADAMRADATESEER